MKAVSTPKRLDEIYRHAQEIPFDSDSKLILMSDCHRGQGNAGDNFLANQTVCFGARNIITRMVLPILNWAMEMNCGKTGS